MSGRVAAVSGRATFEIIRERLGPRAGLANLAASFLINLLTRHRRDRRRRARPAARHERGPRMVDPGRRLRRVDRHLAGAVRAARERDGPARAHADRVRGGPVHARARLGIARRPGVRSRRRPADEPVATYWFYAVALFGAAMTPYEVFFFSSGADRGEVDGEGPREVPAQRAGRVPARRAALDRDRRMRRRRAAARRRST